ncbi:hypothetical protein [Streptomyces ardesiacus]|nr:hypothetical protein [Streptomyces ardesiacus]MCL7368358.1 hypothetical protein [Streptomyces ardesiacus]
MGGSYGGFMSSWLVTQTPSSRRGPRLPRHRPVQPVPDRQSRQVGQLLPQSRPHRAGSARPHTQPRTPGSRGPHAPPGRLVRARRTDHVGARPREHGVDGR